MWNIDVNMFKKQKTIVQTNCVIAFYFLIFIVGILVPISIILK